MSQIFNAVWCYIILLVAHIVVVSAGVNMLSKQDTLAVITGGAIILSSFALFCKGCFFIYSHFKTKNDETRESEH